MKVYKQWLADEDNNIMFMTLREWFDKLQIVVELEKACFFSLKLNKRFDIERACGYFFSVTDIELYSAEQMNKVYYVGNADLSSSKLNVKR